MNSTYNTPIKFDFIPHYRGDGLKPITFRIRLEGEPLDLTGAKVIMQLREQSTGRVHYEFNSELEGERRISIQVGGLISLPEIKAWDIESNTYNHDLQVILEDGFVITFIKGVWKVNQDITQDE